MIRTVLTPNDSIVSFSVPENYVGRQLEIIAFVVDDVNDDIIYATKEKKTFSAIKLKTKGFKFNRDEANER